VKRKESRKKVQRAKDIAEVKSVKVGILERGNRGFAILVSENSEIRERRQHSTPVDSQKHALRFSLSLSLPLLLKERQKQRLRFDILYLSLTLNIIIPK